MPRDETLLKAMVKKVGCCHQGPSHSDRMGSGTRHNTHNLFILKLFHSRLPLFVGIFPQVVFIFPHYCRQLT
jgi:hypothetical protein